MGARYSDAYADAVYLLERGADPNRVAADGMNFSKMLIQHWEHFTKDQAAPPEFARLWDWAETHGIVGQTATYGSMDACLFFPHYETH